MWKEIRIIVELLALQAHNSTSQISIISQLLLLMERLLEQSKM